MSKVCNETKLILELAECKAQVHIDGVSGSKCFSKDYREGYRTGFKMHCNTLEGIVKDLEESDG